MEERGWRELGSVTNERGEKRIWNSGIQEYSEREPILAFGSSFLGSSKKLMQRSSIY